MLPRAGAATPVTAAGVCGPSGKLPNTLTSPYVL